MAEKIQLEVVTPERRVLAEPVDMVTVPGLGGELGILPGHTPLISQLQTGVLTYVQDGKSFQLHVSGGFVEVRDDHVSVLAEVAERPDEIDAARAKLSRDVSRSNSTRGAVLKRTSKWRENEAGSIGRAPTARNLTVTRIRADLSWRRISLTAFSKPTKIARATMLWPMLNSVICLIAATAPTFRKSARDLRRHSIHTASPVQPLLSTAVTRARVRGAFAVNAARSERRFSISRSAQLDLLRADVVRNLDLFGSGSINKLARIFPLSQLRSTVARTIARLP
jgi:F-type H+-transporting ATPase subunit epsilon